MDKVIHKTLISGEDLSTEIVFDGCSAPMVEFRFSRYNLGCLFSKDQLEELVKDLQRRLAEL